MSKTYNLFISHSWTYSDAYDRLKYLIDNRPYFTFIDYSVPKDNPIHNAPNQAELYDAIKRHIQPCHVVIILAGVYASYSKWIDFEMQIARRGFSTPKPVIAVSPWGAERTSIIAKENADLVVGWNTESIINGIRQLAG